MLALMDVHGLRVSEVAGLKFDDLDLTEGVVTVLSKRRKVRTVYLTDQTTQVLVAWLEVRGDVALDGVHALFVVIGLNGPGTAIGARVSWPSILVHSSRH
jgi:integrase/recombinase XerC